SVIDQMTLFEFLTWLDFDRSSSMNAAEMLEEPYVENSLWRTDFNQPPLLKTSALLPRIVLSCGTILIQRKEPSSISFTCRYDDSMLAIYSILSIGIPYRDAFEEFLDNKQGIRLINLVYKYIGTLSIAIVENDIKALHQILLKN
ncbi:unnamed protein product, partial [Adineta steineri]